MARAVAGHVRHETRDSGIRVGAKAVERPGGCLVPVGIEIVLAESKVDARRVVVFGECVGSAAEDRRAQSEDHGLGEMRHRRVAFQSGD